MTGRPLLVVAGEASGDQRAARLVEELHRRRPELQPFGLGGEEMQGAGVELLARSEEISVVGIMEALKILPRARQIYRQLLEEVESRGCRRAVLIDFPDFNLRLGRALHRRGVRVLYYVSPQVWAWRRRRVHLIRKVVDKMLVLFPFEVDFYREHGIEARCVGHPLVDEVPELKQIWEDEASTAPPYRVVLLPGSRTSEVEALLPTQLAGLSRIAESVSVEAQVIVAPGMSVDLIESHVGDSELAPKLVTGERHQAIANAHLAICASGTATLETGLLGTPLVVVYKMTNWTYRLARRMVRLPYISLVNLVLGRAVVPELIQEQTNPEHLSTVALDLLQSRERVDAMRQELKTLRTRLGEHGASRRAAEAVDEWLEETAA